MRPQVCTCSAVLRLLPNWGAQPFHEFRPFDRESVVDAGTDCSSTGGSENKRVGCEYAACPIGTSFFLFVELCAGLSTWWCAGYCDGSGLSCVDTSDSTLGTSCTAIPETTSRCVCTTGPLPENADCEDVVGNGYSGKSTSY